MSEVATVEAEGGRLLGQADLQALLGCAEVQTPRQRLCGDADEVVSFGLELGSPVALKLINDSHPHKSDIGGVILGVDGEAELRAAAEQLDALCADLDLDPAETAILVQEMVPAEGTEVLVGLKRDPTFGPVIVVGPGGRLVEIVGQVAVRRCPVSAAQGREMLGETVLGELLGGFRGEAASDAGLPELIERVSRLWEDEPGLQELDLNPVIPRAEGGPIAVDARAVVGPPLERREAATAPPPDLTALFEPRSILVVGASAKEANKPGNRVLRYLQAHGYGGQIYTVHPRAKEIEGVKAYPSIEALPTGIDAACLAVPAVKCPEVLEQAAGRGVRAAVVFSSGFAEAGDQGAQDRLAEVAERRGVALCGPNSVGVISPGHGVHLSFSQAQNGGFAKAGSLALVTQSGALGGSLLASVWERGIGVSRFVTVGNQARLTTADYLNFLAADEETHSVCILLEGSDDGPRLLDALARFRDAGKRVIVLKLGRGRSAAQAVLSHTGSVAGDAAVYRAVLREAGALWVKSTSEMLDVAELAGTIDSRSAPVGRRVAVLSTSGGACALVADACEENGLSVPRLPDPVRERLDDLLPAFAATANPVDVTGHVATDPGIYGEALKVVLDCDDVEVVMVMLTTIADPQAGEIAEAIKAQVAATSKTVLVSWTISHQLAPDGLAILAAAGIPVFQDPSRGVRALAVLAGAR